MTRPRESTLASDRDEILPAGFISALIGMSAAVLYPAAQAAIAVSVLAKAVITPSVRDELRDKNIELIRQAS